MNYDDMVAACLNPLNQVNCLNMTQEEKRWYYDHKVLIP